MLTTHTIRGHHDGPHFLISGGVHGDEFESMVTIRRLIKQVQPEELSGTLTLIPCVNEAAFWDGERAANDDKLDLARTCPGDPNGSVTERTANAISKLIESADYYIDLHSGGKIMRVAPMVGYGLVPDADVLDTQRAMARAMQIPIIWGTQSKLHGRTLSVARDAKVPALYTEWLGGGECCPKGVETQAAGCLNVMAYAGMLEREIPPFEPDYVVEDDRPNAGYMQLNYQSPVDGFFESHVEMRQRVKVGDTIGTVSDFLGENVVDVPSIHDGIVLTIRVYNRVFQGDSLAVIIEP